MTRLSLIKQSEIVKNTDILLDIINQIKEDGDDLACASLTKKLNTFYKDIDSEVSREISLQVKHGNKPLSVFDTRVSIIQEFFGEIMNDLFPSIACGFNQDGSAYANGDEWGDDVQIDDYDKLRDVWRLQEAEDSAWCIEQDEKDARLLTLELEVEAENKASMQAENNAELEDYLANPNRSF